MSNLSKRAAQYIRMSTDRQDVSPLVQRSAIAAFASANGIEVTRSYEDEGKSGLAISNRPGLRSLLTDVAEGNSFTEILVYDVSRWGRFQDVDEAAYYEFHCRLHGVQVVYVSEPFGTDQTSATVLLKSMKRVMAAEYSRDLALKARAGQERVIAMGFQMGALPALGYRRCSVSADGSRRIQLEHGQRKLSATDRVEWVLAPEVEVELVRRLCADYVGGRGLEEIVALVNAEGWRTEKGAKLTAQCLRCLFRNEALIGNFVWGGRGKDGKVIRSLPSQMKQVVPRIVDDATWVAVRKRIAKSSESDAKRKANVGPKPSCVKTEGRARQLSLPFARTDSENFYRRTLGQPSELRKHPTEFGRAMCAVLRSEGVNVALHARTNSLVSWTARVRIRLMWPIDSTTWFLGKSCPMAHVHHLLVARMAALYSPIDFFLLPPRRAGRSIYGQMKREAPRELKPYWYQSPGALLEQLDAIFGDGNL